MILEIEGKGTSNYTQEKWWVSILRKWHVEQLVPGLFMLNEECSEEEPEKFFNADREPGQKPPAGGCCLGGLIGLLLLVLLLMILF